MKKIVIASLIGIVFPLAISCERQNWDDTKIFHDVPGKKHHDAKNGEHKPEKEKEAEKGKE